jgi:DUF4097 and DUF4098 domain-containing protein YvlB
MTQKEYLNALEEALNGIDPKDKEELMADFKEHFDIGLSEGKSEQDIIDHLGPVNDLVESLDLKRLKTESVNPKPREEAITGEIESVIIDAQHADVTITPSNDDQSHVEYEISKRLLGKLSTEVTTRQEGKTLFVSVITANKLFHSSSDSVDLDISLPKHLKTLQCKTTSGDLDVQDLSIDHIELHSISGDIEAEEISTIEFKVIGVSSDVSLIRIGGDLHIKTVSGDIEIENHTGSALNVETVSGDIEYDGKAQAIRTNSTSGDGDFTAKDIQSLNANTVSGDVELHLGIEDKGLTIAFISNSGELRIGEAEYDTPRHNQTITIGDGAVKVNLKSVSGDFSIE